MRRGVRSAARVFRGRGFHQLDAGEVRIVNVVLPFAVAADFGFVVGELAVRSETVSVKLIDGFLHIVHTEAKMVLYAEFLMIGVGGNVKHVFDPVRAVGDLDFEPIDVGVFSRGAGRLIRRTKATP